MTWTGPYDDGITQSMLAYWLQGCPHRFYIKYVEGLRHKPVFNHKLEFGSYFHECVEGGDIDEYEKKLLRQYPVDQEEIRKWKEVCKHHFPLYQKHWQKFTPRFKYLLREEVFNELYQLPSGRTIRLRGKWDGVIKTKSSTLLMETKTKGWIDEEGLVATICDNLQVMFYLLTLYKRTDIARPEGVLYNVIRRPLGDQRAPRPRKMESLLSYLERVFFTYESTSKQYDGPYPISEHLDRWFYRWWITITSADLERFRSHIFDPIVDGLCDWWDAIVNAKPSQRPWFTQCDGKRVRNIYHHIRPFGLFEGDMNLRKDYYDYIVSGNKSGLVPTELFTEL
jgi:hypothetical protein